VSLSVGARMRAQNSACEVIVVKGTDSAAELRCAGLEMLTSALSAAVDQVSDGPAIQLGKRYTDPDGEIEVLCTKPGYGPLSFGDQELAPKPARALPASD
jgi:hypothetical protein